MDSMGNQEIVLNSEAAVKGTYFLTRINGKVNSQSWTKLICVVLMFSFINIAVLTLLKPEIASSPLQQTVLSESIEPLRLQTPTLLSSPRTSSTDNFDSQQIRKLNSEQTTDQSKPLDLQPVYIWLGDQVPDHHQKKLNDLKFVYKFRLIRNCDLLLADMEKELKQKFNRMIYETVNMKSDLCRFIYLYYYGGLYLDLDTQVDLPCLNSYLKDKRIFFESTPQNTIDIYAIYTAKPLDPEWMKAIKAYNTYNSFFKYYTSYSACTHRISDSVKKIGRSGCVKHRQERSWIQK